MAIVTGERGENAPRQRWAAPVGPDAALYTYSKAEQGDHLLMFKNPVKFTSDLRTTLDR